MGTCHFEENRFLLGIEFGFTCKQSLGYLSSVANMKLLVVICLAYLSLAGGLKKHFLEEGKEIHADDVANSEVIEKPKEYEEIFEFIFYSCTDQSRHIEACTPANISISKCPRNHTLYRGYRINCVSKTENSFGNCTAVKDNKTHHYCCYFIQCRK